MPLEFLIIQRETVIVSCQIKYWQERQRNKKENILNEIHKKEHNIQDIKPIFTQKKISDLFRNNSERKAFPIRKHCSEFKQSNPEFKYS